ncbi:MAG: hypothetical protein NTW86_04610 [Candidatus Sumerlaeota bacterium]|nr:hypothetical protein [Candidatus Sumerlaeota bacterium]
MAVEPLIPLRFRDFLFPQALLKETGAEENPLVIRWRAHMRRWPVRLARALADLLFLGLCLYLFSMPAPRGALFLPASWASRAVLCDYALIGSVCLVLRLHLFAAGWSPLLEMLGGRGLESLRPTLLTPNDLFLHPLLLRAGRWRVARTYCVAALISVFAFGIPAAPGDAVAFGARTLAGLNFVLLMGVVASLQFIVEWRLLVGGKWRAWSPAISVSISLALAAFLGPYACTYLRGVQTQTLGDLLLIPAATALWVLALALLAWLAAAATYEDAQALLARRPPAGENGNGGQPGRLPNLLDLWRPRLPWRRGAQGREEQAAWDPEAMRGALGSAALFVLLCCAGSQAAMALPVWPDQWRVRSVVFPSLYASFFGGLAFYGFLRIHRTLRDQGPESLPNVFRRNAGVAAFAAMAFTAGLVGLSGVSLFRMVVTRPGRPMDWVFLLPTFAG